ncbi:917_t:CDS:2 [Ambispora gerdemannii]|uniref:917_t:CDS:1 n=1 Tax=Ambispora gerdemannii TaxID=144530 RepID=A0A9N9FP35_9GLOM|nr:917_t:CDS:2 [Ambispora gerdemannii]
MEEYLPELMDEYQKGEQGYQTTDYAKRNRNRYGSDVDLDEDKEDTLILMWVKMIFIFQVKKVT